MTLLFLIFSSLFGIILIAVGLGTRYLEIQRRQKVGAVLATVKEADGLPQSHVLVQRAGQHALSLTKILERFSLKPKIEALIQQAGVPWTSEKLVALSSVSAAFGLLLGWKLRLLLFTLPSMLAMATGFAMIPWLHLLYKRRNRLAAFEQQFPEALDFLARALRAGHAFPAGLEMLAAEAPEPLQTEFRRVYNEQNLGAHLNDVLKHLAERVPLVDVRFFVAAVLMQREAGGNPGEILTKLASVIRDRFQLKGRVRAVSAHGRLTAIVLTVLPIVVSVGLMTMSPEYLLALARHPTGKLFVLVAMANQLIGYLVMRKIVNIKI